ncbi:MAG: hypothetical protein KBD01_11335 [Acidobacteria bacterium]|nr:hypothetical protein [Acidobacteriota bacterium]
MGEPASRSASGTSGRAGASIARELGLALALLLALAALGYGFLWRPGATPYSPHSDFISEHVSTKEVLYDSVREGRGIPFWRSDKLSGTAGLINPVSQFTYPLHVLFYFLPPLAAAGPTLWLHFLAAGIVLYLAGAAFGLGPWPRLFMATAGAFGFKLILATYAGWLPNIPMIVWFPALFVAVYNVVQRPGPLAALLLALAGAVCLHCGVIQLVYYSGLFALAYVVLALAGRLRRGDARGALRTCGWLAAGAALAVGLSAYLLLPLASEAGLVSRSRTTYEFFLSRHAIRPPQLLTFVLPEALGTPLDHSYPGDELWEDAAYFGVVPLGLAIAGAVLGWRRHPVRFLVGAFAASVLLSMNTPVLRLLFDYFPGFHLFRIPARFLFLAAFFGVALAGIGLQEVLARLSAAPGRRRWAPLLATVLVLAVAGEGAYYARRYLQMVPQAEAVPRAAYAAFLAQDHGLHRVATVARSINYGWAAPLGLQLINGNDSFNYRPYQEYFQLMQWGETSATAAGPWFDLSRVEPGPREGLLRLRRDLLDALNVKYLVARAPLALEGGGLELAGTFPQQPTFYLYRGRGTADLWVYRNPGALPRAFFAGQVVGVPDRDDAIVAEIRRRDLRRCAVVAGEGASIAAAPPGPADTVIVEAFAPGALSIATAGGGERFLVVSETWHPGWRATLDGRPARLYRTNLSLLGLVVPAGSHRVELVFRPLRWSASLAASVLAATLLIALAGLCAVRSRARRRPEALAAAPARL